MRKVICIIDDDPIYQFLTKKVIGVANIDYDVLSFKNGQEALDFFALDPSENLPNVILLDLEMPIMDGWLFLREMENQNTTNTAIYIVSSSISQEDKETAKQFTKIKGHYSKPFNVDKIRQITEQLSKEE